MNQSENTESFLKAESRILLAGNGINDAQKIQWDDMLRFVQDKMLESKDISETDFNEDIRAVSPTLFFESLCKKFSDPNEGEKRLRQLVFLLISTHFTATLGIPLSSPALKKSSFNPLTGLSPALLRLT